MHKLDGILHEYLFFGEEKEMEELKCFFLLLLSVIKHKICKHRDYNETREEQGKYLILLSLFTGHFHKLRNVGKIMEKKKMELPASSCSCASSGISSCLL